MYRHDSTKNLETYFQDAWFFIDNIFIMFASHVFQQTIGFPMETNCAPLSFRIVSFSFEADFVYTGASY